MGKTKEKCSTIMKKVRYNQSELSNPNLSVFPEDLTILSQRVEYYNIYTGPYRGDVTPTPPRRSVVGFGSGLIDPWPPQREIFGSSHNSGL